MGNYPDRISSQTLAAALALGGGSGGDVTKQYVDEHLALKSDKTETAEYPISSSAFGTSFVLTDAADAPLAGLVIEGRTTSSGGAITNVGDNGLSVTACGKNLLDKGAECTTGVTLSITNGEIVSNRYLTTYNDYIPCTENTTYVLSAESNNNTICAYRQDKTYISGISNFTEGTTTPLVFTTPAETAYLRISLLTDQTNSAQLELGSTATPYEPYKGSTAVLSTGLPLCSVGDVKDTADFTAGVVHKKCEKIVLNGTEDWVIEGETIHNSRSFRTTLSQNAKHHADNEIGNFVSNSLIRATPDDVYDGISTNAISVGDNQHTNILRLRITDISTTSDLAIYLASNPVTVVYELAEPYDVPMTASEISAYHNLRTFENITNITCTDSPQMTVNYLLNTDNGKAVGQLMRMYSETILYQDDMGETDVRQGTTITLSQAFTNFDEIIIEWGYTQNNYYETFSNCWRASYWSQIKEYQANNPNKTVEINMNYYNQCGYICFTPTADDRIYITTVAMAGGVSRYITKIIGRKYSAA